MLTAEHSSTEVDGCALMRAAQDGDVDAFAEVYSRYRRLVFTVAYRRLPALAEEITQDVFVRALANLGRWTDQGKSPGAWLNTITVNLCRDRAAQLGRRRTFMLGEAEEIEALAEPDARTPELAALDSELRDGVSGLLSVLTDDQRTAIVLHYLDDLALNAIAERMGRPVTSVKMLLVRGRSAMRRLVECERRQGGAAC